MKLTQANTCSSKLFIFTLLGGIGGRRRRGRQRMRWHHWLDGRESQWTLGVGDWQGGLACCDSWGRKESDTTEWLNWTESIKWIYFNFPLDKNLGCFNFVVVVVIVNFNCNFVHFSSKTYASVSLECTSGLQATTANQYKLGGLKQRMFFLLHFFAGQNRLENPRDGGAWWAAVSGVTQSRTRLKRLSSSSPKSSVSHFLLKFWERLHFLFLPASVDLCLHMAISSVSLFFCVFSSYKDTCHWIWGPSR